MRFVAIILIMVTSIGCGSADEAPVVTDKVATKKVKPVAFDRFEFRSTLSRKESATVKDMVILVSQSYKEERDKHSHDEWYAAFVKLGWIADDLDLDALGTRGQLGRLVAGRMNLKGNLFLQLFGPTERYGMRELLRLGFIKSGFPNENVSGSALMNVQSKSTTWLRKLDSRYDAYTAHTESKLKEAFSN